MGQIIPKPPLEFGLGARILSPDPLCFLPPRASHRRPPAEVPHTIHPAEGVRLLWAARGDVATPGSPALPCYGRLNAMGSEAPICQDFWPGVYPRPQKKRMAPGGCILLPSY